MSDNAIFLGKSDKREELFLPLANRHGLVTGATGTARPLLCRSWPKFLQGRRSGFCRRRERRSLRHLTGRTPQDSLIERAKEIVFDDYGLEATPTIFWDLFGEQMIIARRLPKWAR